MSCWIIVYWVSSFIGPCQKLIVRHTITVWAEITVGAGAAEAPLLWEQFAGAIFVNNCVCLSHGELDHLLDVREGESLVRIDGP